MRSTAYTGRWLLMLVCVCTGMLGVTAPWGSFEKLNTPGGFKSTLTPILNGNLNINLQLPKEEEKNRPYYEAQLRNAVSQWKTKTTQFINQSGQAQQLAPVAEKLRKPTQVNFVGQSAHLAVKVMPASEIKKICGKDAVACVSAETNTMYLAKQQDKTKLGAQPGDSKSNSSYEHTVLHEFGHTLGLTDQYLSGRYRHEDKNSQVYCSSNPQACVMGDNGALTCDDATGVVALAMRQDSHLTQNNAQQTWRGLCPGSTDVYNYQGGRVQQTKADNQPVPNYKAFYKDNAWTLQQDQQAPKTYRVEASAQGVSSVGSVLNAQITPVEKNAAGQVIRGKGSNAEDVYFAYYLGKETRMAFSHGKLVWAETIVPTHVGNKTHQRNQHFIQIGGRGAVTTISYYSEPQWVSNSKQNIKFMDYQEQRPGQKPLHIQVSCYNAQGPRKELDCSKNKITRNGNKSVWFEAGTRGAERDANTELNKALTNKALEAQVQQLLHSLPEEERDSATLFEESN